MEIWKEIKGFETEYQISNFGNVKSLMRFVNSAHGINHIRTVSERILKPDNRHGYKLAKEYNVSPSTIYDVLSNRYWTGDLTST